MTCVARTIQASPTVHEDSDNMVIFGMTTKGPFPRASLRTRMMKSSKVLNGTLVNVNELPVFPSSCVSFAIIPH